MTKLQIDAAIVQQALDALKNNTGEFRVEGAVSILRAALQQPEQQSLRHEPFNHRTPMQPDQQEPVVSAGSITPAMLEPLSECGRAELVTAMRSLEQQAQAGEPDVVAYGAIDDYGNYEVSRNPICMGNDELITMQSHREAIAKKDEALKACLETLKRGIYATITERCDAITKAQAAQG